MAGKFLRDEIGNEHRVGELPSRWKSCAQWPDGLLSFGYADHNNTTTDLHDTMEQAEAVCRMLEREGLGGERIHFPLKTWVEPPALPT
jgi:hypothetical protein